MSVVDLGHTSQSVLSGWQTVALFIAVWALTLLVVRLVVRFAKRLWHEHVKGDAR